MTTSALTMNILDRDAFRMQTQNSYETRQMVETLRGKVLVIKLGGSTLEEQRTVLQDIIWLHQQGVYPLLVHGGGPAINAWLEKLAIPVHFENGLRVTDAQTLEIVRMVLLGKLNPELVMLAKQLGGQAIGLSGIDGGMVHARIADERLGFVGMIEHVDVTPLRHLLKAGFLPIIAPLGMTTDGRCLNINADHVASELAGALEAEKLFFLSNVMGICRANGQVIPEVSANQARWLIKEGVISGGMLPKVQACLDSLVHVPNVHILDGREPHALLQSLCTQQRVGTVIVR